MDNKFYSLPDLPYPADALSPVISKEQLLLHHSKHHKSYVENANGLLKRLDESRLDGESVEVGVVAKQLSFNVGGDTLHSLFWRNLTPISKYYEAGDLLKEDLEKEYGSIDRFKSEFFKCATTIEGSGWAALSYCPNTERLLITQIGNHNLNIVPAQQILLVLDMWEHAYYLDYKNDKKAYAGNFWQIINWSEVENRLGNAKQA